MIIKPAQAVELLLKGNAIALPTETVYGLAALATDPAAIAKVFEIKNRPPDNPLICHFHNEEQIRSYVNGISPNTKKLLQHFSPGPVSFMIDLPGDSLLKFATCGLPVVIARIPSKRIFLSILRKVKQPLAAPSANTSGKVSPTSAQMVEDDLGGKIEGIVDGGISSIGLESTIVDARSDNDVFILRPGAIGEDEIKNVLPDVRVKMISSSTQATPGSKYRHYAPATPIVLIHSPEEILNQHNTILLLTTEGQKKISGATEILFKKQNVTCINIGSDNDLNILAKHFYQNISSVDSCKVSKAFFLKPLWGNSSLAKALDNRLEKIISR